MLRPYLTSPTGLVVWQVPDSVFEIMWAGPGARLYFGQATKPGGLVTSIKHPVADGSYDSRKDAQAAVDAFIAVLATPGVS